MARKRKPETAHFPKRLYRKLINGKSRLYVVRTDGSEKYFPEDTPEHLAIAAVVTYNKEVEGELLEVTRISRRNAKNLSHWLPHVFENIKSHEKLAPDTLKTIEADIKRLTALHGRIFPNEYGLSHVREYLDVYCKGKSNNVKNRKVNFLNKVFEHLIDLEATTSNPAANKKLLPKQEKKRQRLGVEEYKLIEAAAPHWLKIAMQMSLQTTHATLEVSRFKYSDVKYLDKPILEDNLPIFGYLKVHRQKTKNKPASKVMIPVTNALREIIESSKDNIKSPYIVHKKKTDSNEVAKELTHETQITSKLISRTFSDIRDKLGLYDHLDSNERPTFHEIRSLSLHKISKQGFVATVRAGHSSEEVTKKYIEGHEEWSVAQPTELYL